jgi:hypothetical protein
MSGSKLSSWSRVHISQVHFLSITVFIWEIILPHNPVCIFLNSIETCNSHSIANLLRRLNVWNYVLLLDMSVFHSITPLLPPYLIGRNFHLKNYAVLY